MKCHYEVLEVDQKATDEEIKKSYRKLALVWHPDKNPDRIQECTEYFAVIQQAYDVLSDPHERAWYDRHREQILKGGIDGDYVDKSVNLFPYFSASCYRGYSDSDRGFYTVYRQLFELLATEDLEYIEKDSDRQIPGFGDSASDYDTVVHPFYAYWQSYSTAKSYAWKDKYDIRQADNRRVLRVMEKENKKLRDSAKKERNEEVRELVRYVRKRDKRVEANRQLLAQKRVEREAQVQVERDKQRREQQAKLADYRESDWSAKETHDKELRVIESLLKAEFGSTDSDSDSVDDLDETGERPQDDADSLDLSAALADQLFCVACEKSFKTKNAYDNHQKSKKHRDNVAHLKKEMAADDLVMLNLGDDVVKPESSTVGSRKPKNKKRHKKKPTAANADSDHSSGEEIDSVSIGPVVADAEQASPLEFRPTTTIADENLSRKVDDSSVTGGDEKCGICGRGFESRNKLFAHIKASGHAQLKETPEEFVPKKSGGKKANRKR